MDSIRQRAKIVQSAPIDETVGSEFRRGYKRRMRSVEAVIREVAQSEVPVLLLAESGAGKKATARRVHDLSRRRGQPFRIVSCANLKSEDFADPAWQSGLLNGGTVFFKEVAELCAEGQAWLIQALTPGNAKGGRAPG